MPAAAVKGLAFILACLAAALAVIHWSDDRHPLLIDAACGKPVNPCLYVDCEKQQRLRDRERMT